MQTTTYDDASTESRELGYVTAHFRDLQGLRMAPFWAALLALTSLATTSLFPKRNLACAAVVLVAAQFGWLHLSGRWYERRYGVVKEPEPAAPSTFVSILHSETRPLRAVRRRYGYMSNVNAVLFLVWALALVPAIFLGHLAQPGLLAMLVAAYQILPRFVYPLARDWSVLLRRILAVAALIAGAGIYLEYRLGRMDLLTWMAWLLSIPLLLDLYDHWLLNRLLSGDLRSGGVHPKSSHE